MNKINPKKLYNSKWTAVSPNRKEKHFIVCEVEYDEDGEVITCIIEAVLTKRQAEIDWKELQQDSLWLHGWQ